VISSGEIGWKESRAVMDGDGNQMLRGWTGTETIPDGDGREWIERAVMDGDGLISHYRAGL